jgi:hypothetical protein
MNGKNLSCWCSRSQLPTVTTKAAGVGVVIGFDVRDPSDKIDIGLRWSDYHAFANKVRS